MAHVGWRISRTSQVVVLAVGVTLTLATVVSTAELLVPGVYAAGANPPVTIRFSEYPRPHEDEMLKGLLAKFTEQTGIQVKYEPVTDYTKMTTEMVAGTAPDVVCWWGADFRAWAEQGFLADLDPYVQAQMKDDLPDFAPGQIRGFRYQGKLIGLPQYLGTVAVWYNRDMFDAGGLKYPGNDETWESMLTIARKLTVSDGTKVSRWGWHIPMTLNDRLAYWVRQAGGEMQPPGDETKLTLDQPAALKAMHFLQDLVWKYKVSPTPADIQYKTVGDAFTAEMTAMGEDGSYLFSFIMPKVKFQVGLAPLAQGPGGRSTLATMDGYGMYTGSKHKDEAFALIRFLVSPYAMQVRALFQGLQPARRSVGPEWADLMAKAYPNTRSLYVKVFVDAMAYAEPEPFFVDNNVVSKLLYPALSAVFWQNKMSPEQAMGQVVPQINAELAQAAAKRK
ncbi:MAG: sugar ABC transporter substrate-binding protein [Limnochordaceae bacterium]|nr:sugar ABC transporter substrate-binding protein [Limnochordaceae bacterium]